MNECIKIKSNVGVFHHSRTMLGEGLFIGIDTVYWLDIINKLLMLKTYLGFDNQFSLPEQASAIWKVEKKIVYLASESGICTFNLETKHWEVIGSLPACKKENVFRANDGGIILNDKYLFGTMEKKPYCLSGSLYLTDGLKIDEIYRGLGIPNSFIKLNENEILISDSFCQKVYHFTFCLKSERLISQDVWLDLRGADYIPDGGCMDRHGNIYIAMWDGACINKYDTDANLIASYSIPALRPTNCKLSKDEKILYITTAMEGLSKTLLEKYPGSGSILSIDMSN